jgi:hypothetical protein
MSVINQEYLKGLLAQRKDLLRRETKQMVLDKLTPLNTIRANENEMTLIDTQIKALEKA